MARFQVLKQSFIDNRIVNEGDIIEHDGLPGDNLKPIDAPATALAADAADGDARSTARRKLAAQGVADLPAEGTDALI